MAKLYIIGAGSSKNYEQSRSPVPGLEVPVNNDFFEMAKKVIDHYNLAHMVSPIIGLNHFIGNINRLFGYSNDEYDTSSFLDNRLSLEEIMVHFSLEKDILDDNMIFHQNQRTKTLNELLAYTLAESLSGEICTNHVSFAKKVCYNDIIWNFNYDILMDNALRSIDKFNDFGYKMHFNYAYNGLDWEKTSNNTQSITMLKLHGSLNWLKCNSCGVNLLLRSMKDVPALWKGIKELNIKCPSCNATKYTGLERYIIPPSVKVFSDIAIRHLWKIASNISDIDQIVTVGYSFSDADPQVKMLLRVMCENNAFIDNIPINIVTHNEKSYCAIKKRLKKVFPNSIYSFTEAYRFYT